VESFGEERQGESFAVSPAPESAIASDRYESLNVCRVAALATLLDDRGWASEGIATPLEEMGFSPPLAVGRWTLGLKDPIHLLTDLELDSSGESRMALWVSIQEQGSPHSSVGFLMTALGSPHERESAAAAAAWWQLLTGRHSRLWAPRPFSTIARERELGEARLRAWNPERWRWRFERFAQRFGDSSRQERRRLLLALAESRLVQALHSPDPITVSLAAAAGLAPMPPPSRAPHGEPSPKSTDHGSVSTMVHGTWGWKGEWWRPQGDFHSFVLGGLRPNLYAGGARFSWSGFYRQGDRERAAADFREWQDEIATGGLQSVFAHSYGGEVTALAVLSGASIKELVLLSSPVTDPVIASLDRVAGVVDVRLRFDPVLALARTRQRFPAHPKVKTIQLQRWTLSHSSTHDERVWGEEGIAQRAGL
jgi:hypothetical protein